MNLFFLAVLLTPVPLPLQDQNTIKDSRSLKRSPSATSPTPPKIAPETQTTVSRFVSTFKAFLPPLITRPHPPEWKPHPAAIVAPLTVLCARITLLPFSIMTPHFWPFLLIPHRVLFRPLYLDRLAPLAYGPIKHPHRTYLAVYRFLSYASFLLYLKQTFVAILDNDPGAFQHRHSQYLASLHLPHEHRRGPIQRATNSISRVLGSLGDHPAVASVGWDVLMCAVSLAAWASIRGIDVGRIAAAAGLTTAAAGSKRGDSSSNSSHARASSTASNGSANASSGPKVRRRRKKPQTEAEGPVKDGDFSPGRAVAPIVFGEEEQDENLEAGAVSWALFTLGGLGVMASGVLGAEFET